jgi:hypothetical protein
LAHEKKKSGIGSEGDLIDLDSPAAVHGAETTIVALF